MKFIFEAKVLGKYNVSYYLSDDSGLIQTEKPHWLSEAYSEAIAHTDTGLITRNINNQHRLEPILDTLFSSNARFLDIGGGYGMLTRLLRDIGFDCYTYDAYCENIFSKSFEPDSNFSADALFAFEVLEHIEDPLTFLKAAFEQYNCSTIIFSTLTYQRTIPDRDWWYFSFETGQHISFYQPRTLNTLANVLGLNYYQLDEEYHIITEQQLSSKTYSQLANKKKRKKLAEKVRKKRKGLSKTWSDHELLKDELIATTKVNA